MPTPNPLGNYESGAEHYNLNPDMYGNTELYHQPYVDQIDTVAPEDCCEPCDCNCEVHTDWFRERVGATNPQDITKDRANLEVWTKDSGDDPALTADYCEITGPLKITSKYKVSRYNNFSASLHLSFMDMIPGQVVKWYFNDGDMHWRIELMNWPQNPSGFWSSAYEPHGMVKCNLVGGPAGSERIGLLVPRIVGTGFLPPPTYSGLVMHVRPGGILNLIAGCHSNTGMQYPAGITIPLETPLTGGGMGIGFEDIQEVRLFGHRINNSYEETNRNHCQKPIYGQEQICTSDKYTSPRYHIELDGFVWQGFSSLSFSFDCTVADPHTFTTSPTISQFNPTNHVTIFKTTIPQPVAYGASNWDVYFILVATFQDPVFFGFETSVGPIIAIDTHYPGPYFGEAFPRWIQGSMAGIPSHCRELEDYIINDNVNGGFLHPIDARVTSVNTFA